MMMKLLYGDIESDLYSERLHMHDDHALMPGSWGATRWGQIVRVPDKAGKAAGMNTHEGVICNSVWYYLFEQTRL